MRLHTTRHARIHHKQILHLLNTRTFCKFAPCELHAAITNAPTAQHSHRSHVVVELRHQQPADQPQRQQRHCKDDTRDGTKKISANWGKYADSASDTSTPIAPHTVRFLNSLSGAANASSFFTIASIFTMFSISDGFRQISRAVVRGKAKRQRRPRINPRGSRACGNICASCGCVSCVFGPCFFVQLLLGSRIFVTCFEAGIRARKVATTELN